MTKDPQRHLRLRLARRRTAPTRVRARVLEEPPGPHPEPDEEPPPNSEPSRLRRLWKRVRGAQWSHIITVAGTALAAVAAVGGLWASAIATYWSQQTAKDQLQQSQDDAEQERRAQAQAVSYWAEPASNGWTVHTQNHSPDPVPWLPLTVETKIYEEVKDPDGWTLAFAKLKVVTSGLAPCTELIYAQSQFQDGSKWTAVLGTRDLQVGAIVSVPQARFTDKDGQAWMRTTQTLQPWPDIESLPEPRLLNRTTYEFGPSGVPEVKTTPSCGGQES